MTFGYILYFFRTLRYYILSLRTIMRVKQHISMKTTKQALIIQYVAAMTLLIAMDMF